MAPLPEDVDVIDDVDGGEAKPPPAGIGRCVSKPDDDTGGDDIDDIDDIGGDDIGGDDIGGDVDIGDDDGEPAPKSRWAKGSSSAGGPALGPMEGRPDEVDGDWPKAPWAPPGGGGCDMSIRLNIPVRGPAVLGCWGGGGKFGCPDMVTGAGPPPPPPPPKGEPLPKGEPGGAPKLG